MDKKRFEGNNEASSRLMQGCGNRVFVSMRNPVRTKPQVYRTFSKLGSSLGLSVKGAVESVGRKEGTLTIQSRDLPMWLEDVGLQACGHPKP